MYSGNKQCAKKQGKTEGISAGISNIIKRNKKYLHLSADIVTTKREDKNILQVNSLSKHPDFLINKIKTLKNKILYTIIKSFNAIKKAIGKQQTKSTSITTKIDFNKVAIILLNSSEELATMYKNKLKLFNKDAIEFTLSKNKTSNAQLFFRLKKQGIRLITVCSDKFTNRSHNKLRKINTKWKKYLTKNGLMYIHPDILLDNDIINTGIITKRVPNEEELRDIALGVYTLNSLSDSKSGQSVVVQSGKVLAIEAEGETTNDLLERCIEVKKIKKGGVLFITTKQYQRNILDFSVIDTEIINCISYAKLSGIAVNAKYCRIENMQKVIKLANRRKIFIIGI